MPTTPRRVAAALRVRAAAAALAALTLVVASAPVLATDTSGSGEPALDQAWGGASVRDALERGAPVVLRPADRSRLRTLPSTARVGFHPTTGRVRFLSGTRRNPLATATTLRAAAGRLGLLAAADRTPGPLDPDLAARAFLASAAPLFGVGRVADLRTDRVTTTPDGRTVVRYHQRRGAIPVMGGELVVGFDRRDDLTSITGEALPAADAATVAWVPRLSVADARRIAAEWVAREAGIGAADAVTADEGPAIYDPRLMGAGGPPIPRLVWRIDARVDPASSGPSRGPTADGVPVHHLVLVDALDGAVLDAPSRVEPALHRRICDFGNQRSKDFRCRPARVTRDEGDPPSGHQQVDAMYRLLAQVYDFWKDRFGRDGLDGDGQGYVATVRYCLPSWCPMQNAFWEWGPQQAAFGDGWADVDNLVGHEFTHGVLDHEARLFYDYQSGALNESFADIFGEGFDLLDAWGDDRASVRWLIGEDLRGGAARDMQDPTRFGDPDRVRSPRWYGSSTDSGGVHSNSGVGNKAATLIADGGRFNGRSIAGIGLDRMLRIEYEAMTDRLTSASDYLDLHDALIGACEDLVGTARITLAHCRSVRDAVDATEMDLLPWSGAPRQAPVCPPGRYPVTAFEDDLEQPGDGRWSSVALDGGRNPRRYPPNPNRDPDWDGTWASSGRYNFFGDDLARVTNAAMVLTDPVRVPANGLLRFEHGYRFDASSRYWDGGVVEVSVDGGRWIDLGSRFLNSGYTGTIAGGHGNPLRGRRAFVSVSRGWGASRADLSEWAGRRIRIRFRIGTDSSHGSYGWYIDDIHIYRCASDNKAPTGSVRIGDGDPATRARRQTLTITGEDAVTSVTRMRVSNRGTLRNGLLVAGVEMSFRESLDWLLTDAAWGGSSVEGAKRVYVQLRDRAANWSRPFSDRVVFDVTPPVVGRPEPRFTVGATIATDEPRIPVRVAFTATDATSGVARTELERLRDDGDWTAVDLEGPTDTAVTVRLPADATVAWRFRARARDAAGSWSDLATTGPRRIVTTQDGAGEWTWTGDWTTRSPDDAFGATIRTADDAGATGSLIVSGRAVALVAPQGPSMGIAHLLIDGTDAGSVDLYAPDAQARTIVWTSPLTDGDHLLRIEATGDAAAASGGTRVAVDAVLEVR